MQSTFMLATLAVFVHSTAAQPVIYGIGDLPGGYFQSEAFGLSADGSTVVGRSEFSRSYDGCGPVESFHAAHWRRGEGLTALPGGFASGTSVDGRVVVGQGYGQAFRWAGGEHFLLGTLPDTSRSEATGCSDYGLVIVGTAYSDYVWEEMGCFSSFVTYMEALRWTPASGLIGLGHIPQWSHGWSRANAVSADGLVIVGASQPVKHGYDWDKPIGPFEAFRWTPLEGMIELQGIPKFADPRSALGVSGNGRIVVGEAQTPTGTEAYRWDAGAFTLLKGLTPNRSSARAVSDSGAVVVGQSKTA